MKNVSGLKYKTTGILRGPSTRDLDRMIGILAHFTFDYSTVYFSDILIDEISDGEVSFSAEGPSGGFHSLNDVDVFARMAKASPEMYMEVSVEGYEDNFNYTGTDEALHCRLEDGILTVELRTFTRNTDETYAEYLVRILPYEKYVLLFGIEPGSLSEDDYRDFLFSLVFQCFDSPLEPELEEYTRLLGRYNGKTVLDRDAYDAARKKAEDAGLISYPEFIARISLTETETVRYGAMAGQPIS